jgi:alpha-L-fucosidase
MKRSFLLALLFVAGAVTAQTYTPAAANLKARQQFQDMKFGMFIHWGIASVLGDDMWAMEEKKITKKDYMRLIRVFDPKDFDAAQWVSTAKKAGAKYIVFITKHHDGFANWDTKYSDWKITNTSFRKDALKLLSAECKKQGMKLGLYYSTLDWNREDYPRETGRTGQHTGRTGKGDSKSYLKYVRNQLTELLTNYGEITCIWFDGHWDQTNPEGAADRTARIDWEYDSIYGLIHKLQPACLVGNNHHLSPISGEDFQMFEQDLPGNNTSGLNFQSASALPLESCITLNDSWGFRINDRKYKTTSEAVRLLTNAAGRNSNLLLNVGPMANGQIPPESVAIMDSIGQWTKTYGKSIYGTRGGPMAPQPWGVTTQDEKHVYLHVFSKPAEVIRIEGAYSNIHAAEAKSNQVYTATATATEAKLDLSALKIDGPETIIILDKK